MGLFTFWGAQKNIPEQWVILICDAVVKTEWILPFITPLLMKEKLQIKIRRDPEETRTGPLENQ